MKKLLLLLLLSLGFISSADAMTRCPDGSYVSGTSCQRAPNGTYVSGGIGMTRCPNGSYVSGSSCQRAPNGTYVSGGIGMTRCPNGSYVSGSSCQRAPNGTYVSGSSGDTGSSYGNSYYSGSSGVGAAANYNAGALFAEGLFSLFGSSSNNQTNNSNYSRKRLWDFGTTWTQSGNLLIGSNGLRCSVVNISPTSLTCNNGNSYWECGINNLCGSDNTVYRKNNSTSPCTKSSFGSYCCNTGIGTASCQ